MRKHLLFSLLVGICLFLFFSCGKNNSDSSSQIVQQHNTTLEAVEAAPTSALPVDKTLIAFRMPDKIKWKLASEGPQMQTFEGNAGTEILVSCEQGSIIKFPKGVFVYADTKLPVEGPVEINVTEYLDMASILFSGLTTQSGKQIIETGGMLRIDVSSKGKTCEIKDGEYYEIEIPSDIEKPNMELFYGDVAQNGNMNWIAANRGSLMEWQTDNSFANYQIGSIAPTVVCYEGGTLALYEYLNTKIHMPDWTQNIELKARSYVSFMLDHKGAVKKVQTSPFRKTYADKEIVEAFNEMQPWLVPSNMVKGDVKRIVIPVNLEWVKNPAKIPLKTQVVSKGKGNYFNATFITDRYLMASSKLGWVNCDRFNDKNKPRTELFVQMDSTYDATVRIVFTDYKSVLGGIRYTSGFSFRDVPVGEKITVVAMRTINGKYELAMKDCLLTGLPIKDLKFETVDKETMIYKFNMLEKTLNDKTALRETEFVNPLILL